jgi:hypothetical protein
MDLYRRGAFVSELRSIWCVPASMQTSLNMIRSRTDSSFATQARLDVLARSLWPPTDAGAEPEGWARGMTKLGAGPYLVVTEPSVVAAIHVAARAERLTRRPVGLLVWRGAHAWLMSGFRATADPASTATYRVTAVDIEDVWYPRISSIWGRSRRPDSLVPVASLAGDFLPWHRPTGADPGYDGKYVLVLPQIAH